MLTLTGDNHFYLYLLIASFGVHLVDELSHAGL